MLPGTVHYMVLYRHADRERYAKFIDWHLAAYRGEPYISEDPQRVLDKARSDFDPDCGYEFRLVPLVVPPDTK